MSSFVDWGLAARIVRAGAGEGPASMGGALDLDAVHARAELAVLDYTGLRPDEELPRPEWVTRRQWGELNLRSMRELIGPLEGRLAGSLSGPAHSALRAVAGRVVALEVSALIVLASKRVLGQYEFPLLGGERAPRLVFVGPNIDSAALELGGDPGDVLEWVALHEGTHAVHFGSAPWLRAHLGGLAETLLATSPPDLSISELLGRARRLTPSDPRRLLEEARAGGPLALFAPASSRAVMAETQSTMAAIEGYAEHVMDAAAGALGPRVVELRAAMERRRESAGTIARLLAWMLGLEMKMRQYRDGKRFCDQVVARNGIVGLNRAWVGRSSLPNEIELADPELWLTRTGAASLPV